MLEISRADIITTEVVETKDPRRFLKVPIKPYLELLGVKPIPSQVALINTVNSPNYRFICAALSRRQGKTYIANIVAQIVSLVPNSNVLIMSPNYSLSQISFDLQRQLINHFDLEVTRDNLKDKIITLSNGSNIRMGSISQVDSVVGRSYDLIVFDEAALTDDGEDAFNIALRPTLDKANSKAIFISTPRGKNNWFSKFFDRGFSSQFPMWASIKATYHDNPRISEEDILEAKNSMSKQEFAQEYLCEFNTYAGKIWDLDTEHIVDLSDLDPSNMDIIAGLDVGFKDATALSVAAYCWESKKFYIVDEYKEAERTTEQHAIAIKEKLDRWDIDFVFIDSAAAQTKYDFAMQYDISCTNAKKSVLDGIGYVASLFDSGNVLVSKDCKHTLAAIDQYQWDNRPGLLKEKPKHNDASHIADAVRYMLYSFQTSSLM